MLSSKKNLYGYIMIIISIVHHIIRSITFLTGMSGMLNGIGLVYELNGATCSHKVESNNTVISL